MTNKEIITINIGQFGIQCSEECLSNLAYQHSLNPKSQKKNGKTNNQLLGNPNIMFYNSEKQESSYFFRSLLVDTDPMTLEEFRIGENGGLLKNFQYHQIKSVQGSSFTNTSLNFSDSKLESVLEKIQRLAETCDNLQGFIISHSICGGTGSGLTKRIIEGLVQSYSRKTIGTITLFPSPNISNLIVEPYNSVLSMEYLINQVDWTIALQNERISSLCTNLQGMELPDFRDYNKLISNFYSALTTPMRFNGTSFNNLHEFQMSIAPFQKLHFITPSYAPLYCLDNPPLRNINARTMIKEVFNPNLSMVDLKPEEVWFINRHVSCALLFNGIANPIEAINAFNDLKASEKFCFHDLMPCPVKISTCFHSNKYMYMEDHPNNQKELTLLSNNTGIRNVFRMMSHKFYKLHQKKAFLHWFINDNGEEDLASHYQDLREHSKQYQEIKYADPDDSEDYGKYEDSESVEV